MWKSQLLCDMLEHNKYRNTKTGDSMHIDTSGFSLDKIAFALSSSKNIEREIGTVLKSPSSRKVDLNNEIVTPHSIWSECHQVKKRKDVYIYESTRLTKQEFIAAFKTPLAEKLLHFQTVDQVHEGPCSLAAIVHLSRLYDRQHNVMNSTKCTFDKVYKRLGFDMDGYSNWLAFFSTATKVFPKILDDLLFVPLRVRRTYNTLISGKEPTSAGDYNNNINIFFKYLLDNGHAFAVPFEGHFVAVVGYNDTGYLVLNSFGNNTGFDGLWFIDPLVDPTYTQLNFCNGITGIILLR
jgi:hypothetical protein